MSTGANALSSSTKCNNYSLEYMDVLDELNNIEELQLKLDNSTSLTKQYLESFEREIAEGINLTVTPNPYVTKVSDIFSDIIYY